MLRAAEVKGEAQATTCVPKMAAKEAPLFNIRQGGSFALLRMPGDLRLSAVTATVHVSQDRASGFLSSKANSCISVWGVCVDGDPTFSSGISAGFGAFCLLGQRSFSRGRFELHTLCFCAWATPPKSSCALASFLVPQALELLGQEPCKSFARSRNMRIKSQ